MFKQLVHLYHHPPNTDALGADVAAGALGISGVVESASATLVLARRFSLGLSCGAAELLDGLS